MSQIEAIQTFQAITETQEEPMAREYLVRSDWEVVAAVNLYYEDLAQRELVQGEEERLVQVPQPQPPRSFLGRLWTGVRRVGTGALDLLAGVFRSLEDCQSGGLLGTASEQEVDAEVLALVREVSEETKNMQLETQGYRRAMLEAEIRKKPLVVYLHQEPFTIGYLREVVFTPSTLTLLQDNFLVLLLDPSHPDYSLLIHQAGRALIPLLVAVYPVDRDQQAIMGSLPAPLTPSDVWEFLESMLDQADFIAQEIVDDRPSQQDLDRIRRDRLCNAHRLREEQDQALREAESLAAELEASQMAEKERREAEEVIRQTEAAEAESMRVSRRKELGTEPDPGSEAAQVVFRLPDGSKLTRRFLKTATVSSLHLFLDSQETPLPPYDIMTSFPSRSLSDQTQSLEAEGLAPQALLHVRFRDVAE